MTTKTDFMPSAELAALYGANQATVASTAPTGGTVFGYQVECLPATAEFREKWGKTTRTKWMFRGPRPGTATDALIDQLRGELEAARCRLGDACVGYPQCEHHEGEHACAACGFHGRVQASQTKVRELSREIDSLRETIANLRLGGGSRELTLLRELEAALREERREQRAIDACRNDPKGPEADYCRQQVRRFREDSDRLMDRLDDLRRAERRAS